MKIGRFEFNLRELARSPGDLGTLLPLPIGYITVCKLNPAGLLVMMGLVNIATGLAYRLPMPVEPMKVLAVVAIAQAWTPEKVYTSGLVMGIVWLTMGARSVFPHPGGPIMSIDRLSRMPLTALFHGTHCDLPIGDLSRVDLL
jgi:hypothetical protein